MAGQYPRDLSCNTCRAQSTQITHACDYGGPLRNMGVPVGECNNCSAHGWVCSYSDVATEIWGNPNHPYYGLAAARQTPRQPVPTPARGVSQTQAVGGGRGHTPYQTPHSHGYYGYGRGQAPGPQRSQTISQQRRGNGSRPLASRQDAPRWLQIDGSPPHCVNFSTIEDGCRNLATRQLWFPNQRQYFPVCESHFRIYTSVDSDSD